MNQVLFALPRRDKAPLAEALVEQCLEAMYNSLTEILALPLDLGSSTQAELRPG